MARDRAVEILFMVGYKNYTLGHVSPRHALTVALQAEYGILMAPYSSSVEAGEKLRREFLFDGSVYFSPLFQSKIEWTEKGMEYPD